MVWEQKKRLYMPVRQSIESPKPRWGSSLLYPFPFHREPGGKRRLTVREESGGARTEGQTGTSRAGMTVLSSTDSSTRFPGSQQPSQSLDASPKMPKWTEMTFPTPEPNRGLKS